MTDFASLLIPDKGQPAVMLQLVDKAGFDGWLSGQGQRVKTAVAAQSFTGKANEIAVLPGDAADEWFAAVGVADVAALTPWCLARAAERLPAGFYRLDGQDAGPAALGWLLGQYRFDRYRKADDPVGVRVLLSGEPARIADHARIAGAVALVRDLINTPTEDMGPRNLQDAAAAIAKAGGATLTVTEGADLARDYPMIHAVGRAAEKRNAPRLIELVWGNPDHPRIAIVGKGVCFDSGGLDIKPASGMRLMKKDMGGGAHALALAQLVIAARLPVRLHLLVPAVENAIAGNAFRPGDILASRKGLSVEIGNTDAEGRLILGDSLARAVEDAPELIVDFATLTGAARVALGPDLPAMFANDESLAADLLACGVAEDDPLWRMPLWAPYADMLKSDVADIGNAAEGGYAGAITAALFLGKFVPETIAWAHFDTFAWRPSAKPGRPKGGDALGLRAAWAMLRQRYS